MSEQALLEPPAIEETRFGDARVVRLDAAPGPDEWCFCACACKDSGEKANNAHLVAATLSVSRPQP